MNMSLAKTLFVRLGGKISQSLRKPEREVWVIRKPMLNAARTASVKRPSPVIAKRKNSLKSFRMAWEIMTARADRRADFSVA